MRSLGLLICLITILGVAVLRVRAQEGFETFHGHRPPTAANQPDAEYPPWSPHDDAPETGNVIFFHPDGSGLNHWNAARMYWYGPDSLLNWDQLPEITIYRGHMRDQLVGTSHGGATVHAFGYKVQGRHSFGRDGDAESGRAINSLSGYPGSLMREAATAGYPVGVVNDGDAAEPGTAAFLAEVVDREQNEEIVRQFLDGRPGFEGEPLPKVILAGGEGFFLPADAPVCANEISLHCAVHVDPADQRGPSRQDGRNLLIEATDLGYVVIRTRTEFDTLWARIQAEPTYMPMVLGLFARDDTFNDETEERLLALNLVDESMAETKEGRLLIWGSLPGTAGENPPSATEMNTMALELLKRHSEAVGHPFYLVAEVESTDNLANEANAMGTLRALRAADDVIGVFRDFVRAHPNTLLITAADSDAGGLQVLGPAPVRDGRVTTSAGNPIGIGYNQGFALDGQEGQNTPPFVAAPDAFGNSWEFAIGWAGSNDVAGAIVSRAEGLRAELLRTHFSTRFDSTDLYRMQYAVLFGKWLPSAHGTPAPTRRTQAE